MDAFVFATAVFQRYRSQPAHKCLFVWGLGLIFYGIGGACEAFTGIFGFHPVVLKLWYLFGAILVAAWLGQGTVFFLSPARWVRITTFILVAASVFAAGAVIIAGVDPNCRAGVELTGKAFTTTWVRLITPFFNIYGTVTLVGGALLPGRPPGPNIPRPIGN